MMRTRTTLLAAMWIGLCVAACDRGGSTATTYVAWVVPRGAASAGVPPQQGQDGQTSTQADDQRPINVGAITVGEDLSGTLETITPFRQFDIMITPEPSPVAIRPSNQPVLTARVQNI